MTSERDIDRILDHWFTERPTEVADRVLDEVADRIGRQPQQPAWLILWRDSHVNTYLKYAAAVAAVVLVAAVGFAVLRPSSGSNVGGGTATPSPSPTPSASASLSTSPSANVVYPPWFTGVPAGTQSTQAFRPGFTYKVPEGWVNDADNTDYFGLFPDSPANQAEYARSGRIAQAIFMAGVQSPTLICDAAGEARGATAAELVDSLVANEAYATSRPVDVAIGGLTGKQIDYQLDPGWTGSCALRPGDPPTMDYKDVRSRGIFLDTPAGDHLLIIVDSLYSADFEAFLAEAMPIVESFQFDVAP